MEIMLTMNQSIPFNFCKELLMMDVFGRFWCTCNDEKALEVLGDKSKLYMIR